MPQVKDVISILEQKFPLFLAQSWDKAGLQIGSPEQKTDKVLVTLDLDAAALEYALRRKADLIVTHHPFIFDPLVTITDETVTGNMIRRLISAGISVYALHTNLDAATAGLNQKLAEVMELDNIAPLFPDYEDKLFKLTVYVPFSHEEQVRTALAGAGAGHIGQYADCSFRTEGIGTFRPLSGADPFIGQEGRLEHVDEFRLETVVLQSRLNHAVNRMLESHPYEEAAYDIYPLHNTGRIFSMGRRGDLKQVMSLKELAEAVKKKLQLDSVRVVGDLSSGVRTVAVICGGGAGFIPQVSGLFDVLLTGDIKYHEAKNAELNGLKLIDAGHQGTEQIMVDYLTEILTAESKNYDWNLLVWGFKNEPCFQLI